MSEYPKWIDHPTDNRGMTRDNQRIPARILVKDDKEEESYYPKEDAKEEAKPKWPSKKN